MNKPNAAQVAAEHLRATGNPSIMWGDAGLLHEVATKLGMRHEGYSTQGKLLDRIDRCHRGILVKGYFRLPERGLGRLRIFWLPEHAPGGSSS